ncbi:MAG TPA: hypothetical protein EYP36_01340 [Calditrichaeota bacterium]|nr:hypothetical protein [Calditrichota bacterium]
MSTVYPEKDDFDIQYTIDEKDDLQLRWVFIKKAAAYKADVYEWRKVPIGWEDYEWLWVYSVSLVTEQNTLALKPEFYQDNGEWSKTKIILSAVDQNYYAFLQFDFHYDPLDFSFFDYSNFSTVENGLGFFGSAFTDSLIILRDSTSNNRK